MPKINKLEMEFTMSLINRCTDQTQCNDLFNAILSHYKIQGMIDESYAETGNRVGGNVGKLLIALDAKWMHLA